MGNRIKGLAATVEQAEENDEAGDQAKGDDKQDKKKRGRKKLPAHLPRERSVLDPGDVCPDCAGVSSQRNLLMLSC